MSSIHPRRTVHSGSVLAAGVVIDTRSISEAIARRRILALGANAERVVRADSKLVAILVRPVRIDANAATGGLLVRYGNVLSAAPLSAEQATTIQQTDTALLLVEGGAATVVPLRALEQDDPARWLDISPFELVDDIRSLGEVAIAPRSHALVPVEETLARSIGITGPTEEARDAVQSILRRGATSTGARSEAGQLIARLWNGLKRLWATRQASSREAASRSLAPAGAKASLLTALWSAISRFVFSSRLAAFFGRRHAEYLARLLGMFDDNNLDDALRHAIPLSSDVEAALRREPPLRAFGPRDNLAIRPASSATSGELGLGPSLFRELQARYRRAFEHLVARGEIDKAAFVLAELLKANEEAIAFLEKHGRYRLAAEIAEARKLAPGIAVRLWFLAGDRSRAIRIARERDAFADAVARLDATDKVAAKALRLVWADHVAARGAYATAVEAIWPVEDARHLALEWLDRAIDIGGIVGALMLARKARLVPDAFVLVRDQVLALLQADDTDHSVLQALGQELTVDPTPHTRVLAKVTARRLMRDALNGDDDRLVRRLIEASGDGLLRADVEGPRAPSRPHTEPLFVRAGAARHVGNTRAYNEDSYLMSLLDSKAAGTGQLHADASTRGFVVGVFDGTGGRAWASEHDRMVAEPIVSSLTRDFREHAGTPDRWGRSLAAAIERANRATLALQRSSPAYRGTGYCVTVATLSGDRLFIAQVGDTRAYVLRGSTLMQVTCEHTLLNEYRARTPGLTQEEIDQFPHQNVITRVLGAKEDVTADITELTVNDGDVLLLCTDGLYRIVPDEKIRSLLEGRLPHAAADALVSAALDAGAPDNIAVVVAKFEGKTLASDYRPIAPTPFVWTGADGRALSDDASLAHRATPVEIHRLDGDRGALEVHDAAELPDGRMLVALGEIGVWLLARDGRVLTRFAEPATRIVISDHGDRAILAVRRGESYRLARLNILERRARYWCDAYLSTFAPDFDGATWFVAKDDTVYAIDAVAEGWEHTFSVDNAGATAVAIRRRSSPLCVLFAEGEIWNFDTHLRSRKDIKTDDRLTFGSISDSGAFVGWYEREQDGTELRLARACVQGVWKELHIPTTDALRPAPPAITDRWIALPSLSQQGAQVRLFDVAEVRERAVIVLEGSSAIGRRFQGEHLLVFDRGRVLVVSLRHGAVVREHRVS